MLGPWHDELPKPEIGPSLKSLQAMFLDQFIAELSESKPSFVVSELRSRYLAEEYISDARAVTVAPFEAEIHRPADSQRKKIRIPKHRRRQDFDQDIHCPKGGRIGHHWQPIELLD